MGYPWLDEYCTAKQGALRDYKAEWDAVRYLLCGKMFAMCGGDKAGRALITLKLPPEEGEFLRRQYADIIPGYYMNKQHWNTVTLSEGLSDDLWQGWIVHSYERVVAGLPRAKRPQAPRSTIRED